MLKSGKSGIESEPDGLVPRTPSKSPLGTLGVFESGSGSSPTGAYPELHDDPHVPQALPHEPQPEYPTPHELQPP